MLMSLHQSSLASSMMYRMKTDFHFSLVILLTFKIKKKTPHFYSKNLIFLWSRSRTVCERSTCACTILNPLTFVTSWFITAHLGRTEEAREAARRGDSSYGEITNHRTTISIPRWFLYRILCKIVSSDE